MLLLMTCTTDLKILLLEWKMSFEIGSLGCVKYTEKKPTQYQKISGEVQCSVPNFKKGPEKMPGGT